MTIVLFPTVQSKVSSDPIGIRRKLKLGLKDSSPNLSEYSTSVLARNTDYVVGDRVRLSSYTAHSYRCTAIGKTHSTTQPTMPTITGSTVQDGTVIWEEDSDDYDLSIQSALDVFSLHKPSELRADIVGSGTDLYSVPTTWINEFSRIIKIEVPLGNSPPSILLNTDYEVYQSTSTLWKILFNTEISDTFGVYFTGKRDLLTIPEGFVEAFIWLCTGLILANLSTSYITSTDSSINIDTVDYKDKSTQFKNQSKYFLQMYKDFIGIDDLNSVPFSFISNLSPINYPYGFERLTHPRIDRFTR